jgi:hypothetical protein
MLYLLNAFLCDKYSLFCCFSVPCMYTGKVMSIHLSVCLHVVSLTVFWSSFFKSTFKLMKQIKFWFISFQYNPYFNQYSYKCHVEILICDVKQEFIFLYVVYLVNYKERFWLWNVMLIMCVVSSAVVSVFNELNRGGFGMYSHTECIHKIYIHSLKYVFL